MKTKIIYISGNEIFDMADIRTAFDQVRSVLSLGDDTVLFGVPVDNDDVFAPKTVQVTDINLNPTDTADTSVDIAAENIPDSAPVIEEPVKKSHKHISQVDVIADPEIEPDDVVVPDTDVIIDAPDAVPSTDSVDENITNTTATEEATQDDDTPVVPILSILAGGAPNDTAPINTPDEFDDIVETESPDDTPDYDIVQPEPDYDESQVQSEFEDTDTISQTNEDDDVPISITVAETTITEHDENGDIATIDIKTVSVDDLVTDDTPATEKTLEDLLESMSPLSADEPDFVPESEPEPELEEEIDAPAAPDPDDATLAQLANEMATQFSDDAPTPTSTVQKQGRLGKFKSVIGFSSKKRNNDSGIMADLFGWAGVAANDDAFAMPDFFPTNK